LQEDAELDEEAKARRTAHDSRTKVTLLSSEEKTTRIGKMGVYIRKLQRKILGMTAVDNSAAAGDEGGEGGSNAAAAAAAAAPAAAAAAAAGAGSSSGSGIAEAPLTPEEQEMVREVRAINTWGQRLGWGTGIFFKFVRNFCSGDISYIERLTVLCTAYNTDQKTINLRKYQTRDPPNSDLLDFTSALYKMRSGGSCIGGVGRGPGGQGTGNSALPTREAAYNLSWISSRQNVRADDKKQDPDPDFNTGSSAKTAWFVLDPDRGFFLWDELLAFVRDDTDANHNKMGFTGKYGERFAYSDASYPGCRVNWRELEEEHVAQLRPFFPFLLNISKANNPKHRGFVRAALVDAAEMLRRKALPLLAQAISDLKDELAGHESCEAGVARGERDDGERDDGESDEEEGDEMAVDAEEESAEQGEGEGACSDGDDVLDNMAPAKGRSRAFNTRMDNVIACQGALATVQSFIDFVDDEVCVCARACARACVPGCLCLLLTRARAHTHTHAHAHARVCLGACACCSHARARAHTHTRTHTHTDLAQFCRFSWSQAGHGRVLQRSQARGSQGLCRRARRLDLW
jgi:hypothetical protein